MYIRFFPNIKTSSVKSNVIKIKKRKKRIIIIIIIILLYSTVQSAFPEKKLLFYFIRTYYTVLYCSTLSEVLYELRPVFLPKSYSVAKK